MAGKTVCPLCGLEAEPLPYRHRDEQGVTCKRCGDFYIDGLLLSMGGPADEEGKAVLSGHTRWAKLEGNPPPEIGAQNIDEIIKSHANLSSYEKVDLFLLFLSITNPRAGHHIQVDFSFDCPVIYSKDDWEFAYVSRDLATKTLEYLDEPIPFRRYKITPKGWERISILRKPRLADEKYQLLREELERDAALRIDALKEEYGAKGKRYASVLARRIRDVLLENFKAKMRTKVETDKKFIFGTDLVTKPEDISILIRRVKDFAGLEKKLLTSQMKEFYEDCHSQSYLDSDKKGVSEQVDKMAEMMMLDLRAGEYGREAWPEEKNMTEGKIHKPNPNKVMVVYGRNDKARRAMFEFLRSVGLEPIEWGEAVTATGKGSPYVGEVIERAFGDAQAVVVLFTGDDIAYLRKEYQVNDDPPHEKMPTPQARTNAIFEAGMAFGTHPDRTILVELANEKTRPFSDIHGRHAIRISNAVEKRQDLIDRLKTAGCSVKILGKKDWMTCGDFDGAALTSAPKI